MASRTRGSVHASDAPAANASPANRTVGGELPADYATLFQAAPDPYLVLDLDLTITEVNAAYLSTTKWTREELIGRSLFDVLPDDPDDPAAEGATTLRDSLHRVLTSGVADVIPVIRHRIRRPTGELEDRAWTAVNAPVLADDGSVRLVIHRIHDVTELVRLREGAVSWERDSAAQDAAIDRLHILNEALARTLRERREMEDRYRAERQRVESALRESEEQFRTVVDLVPELMWSSDVTGNLWYNSRWYEYTGQTPEQALAWGWADVIHPDDLDASIEGSRRAIEEESELDLEHRIRSSAGEYRWFQVRAMPLRNPDGSVTRWFGSATDVHDRRTGEDLLEERIAAATKELRSLSRQLLRVQEEERQHLARELHDEIGQSLTALQLQIVAGREGGSALLGARQLLAEITQRVSSMSMRLRPAVLDTLGLVPAVVALGNRFGEQSGIDVDVRHDGADRRFTPDIEIAAYRVIQEALTNAARYAKSRRVDIRLTADDTLLTIAVRDHGTGFDATSVDRFGGLGGMRERIDLVGGTLSVDSGPEDGTVIAADIPLDRSTAERES